MQNKGAKITVGGILTFMAFLAALQPYLDLKAQVKTNTEEIKTLKEISKLDHDIIIKMSTQIDYIEKATKRNARPD